MNTAIVARDLNQQAPRSPRDRIDGFVIAARTTDKCRAKLAGKLGEYHFDCPLDNQLFRFKGITGEQFTAAVTAAANYEDVGAWLQTSGTPKTAVEIKVWSDGMEAASMYKDPKRQAYFVENCKKVGINPVTSSTFDWLEADDRASF
jgi:hypothetical protein